MSRLDDIRAEISSLRERIEDLEIEEGNLWRETHPIQDSMNPGLAAAFAMEFERQYRSRGMLARRVMQDEIRGCETS